MFKEKAKGGGVVCVWIQEDLGPQAEKLELLLWVHMDLVQHTRRSRNLKVREFIRRDHVCLIKSIKSKAKELNHWANRHTHEVLICLRHDLPESSDSLQDLR